VTAARSTIRRDADRRVTIGGLAASSLFVALAIASTLLPASVRHGAWLPLHLALPGAATVAIGSVLPFFIASLAAAAPGRLGVRVAVVVSLAIGALGVALGVVTGAGWVAAAGGFVFVSGLVGLGWLLVSILNGSPGTRRGLLPRAYAAAIGNVIVGTSLATLVVAGWIPIAAAWGALKPAHVWLNVFGFVGLVIAATFVHLYPTVVGTRIVVRPSVRVALTAMSAAPAIVAAGYLVAVDAIARAGALLMTVGAMAFVWSTLRVWHARGRWTTDAAWHRFVSWSLAAGAGWYTVGIAIAAARVLVDGASPVGWAIEAVAVPLVVGFVLQVLVGSWTHLVPAIGPGDQRVHLRQRSILATGSVQRLVALNVGVGAMVVGVPLGASALVAGGTLVAGAALVASLALLARAVLVRAVLVRADAGAEPMREVGEGRR
jgi:nitrite reductase (NO-forming)